MRDDRPWVPVRLRRMPDGSYVYIDRFGNNITPTAEEIRHSQQFTHELLGKMKQLTPRRTLG